MRILLTLLAVALCAQETTFRATAPIVLVPATVTDKNGKLVDGLEAIDFLVTDNGRPVKFQLDTSDSTTVPVSLIVAVQTNDISAAALLKIQKIGAMIQPLITGDRGAAALLTVDDRVTVMQDFTADPSALTAAFRQLKPGKARKTVALDAVARAVELFRARPGSERRIVLLIGESKDRGSETSLETALEQLQRENIQVYWASYSVTRTQWTTKGADRPRPTGAENDIVAGLTELARLGKENTADAVALHTGGKKIGFATLRSLEGVISRVGEELHGQYLLSFPAAGPEGFHSISVQLRDAGKNTVASRQGYWAVASP